MSETAVKSPRYKSKLTREQWMLAAALAGVVNACNAPFCSEDDGLQEAVSADPNYVDNVALALADRTSRMALEDTILILEKALRCVR